MQIVGAYEAKTRLAELLRAVERGESFTVTRNGVPVARLLGVDKAATHAAAKVIARMKRARARRPSVTTEDLLAARAHPYGC